MGIVAFPLYFPSMGFNNFSLWHYLLKVPQLCRSQATVKQIKATIDDDDAMTICQPFLLFGSQNVCWQSMHIHGLKQAKDKSMQRQSIFIIGFLRTMLLSYGTYIYTQKIPRLIVGVGLWC